MRSRRQDAWALFGALGLHVAALLALQSIPGESISSSARALPAGSPMSWEVDLGETPAGDTAPEGARESASGAMARIVPRARVRAAELEGLDSESGDVVEFESDAEPEAEVGRQAVAQKPIDLGLGPDGWQRWVTAPKQGEAPRADRPVPRRNRFHVFRAPPASTTGGLQEGLEESDRALGLGPQGRVVSALHKAAHASAAPETGVARFEVTVHRTGAVEVTLGAASPPGQQWKKVAAQVASELRASPPRIPPPREGYKFVVELVAESALPNGVKANDLKKPHLDIPPPKFPSVEEGMAQTHRDNPAIGNPTPDDIAIKSDMPGVYVAENGTVLSYRVGVGAISPGYRVGAAVGPTAQGTFEPSNIGAKPQRMVRTRILEQSVF